MRNAAICSLVIMALSAPLQAEPMGITTGAQLQAAAQQETKSITTAELGTMLQEELDMVLIDIRTPGEVSSMGGTIDAAQNNVIPRGWLEFRAPRVALDKDTPIVVYCGAGYRSPLAAKTLQDMGYTNVMDYPAGFIDWQQSGKPVKAN